MYDFLSYKVKNLLEGVPDLCVTFTVLSLFELRLVDSLEASNKPTFTWISTHLERYITRSENCGMKQEKSPGLAAVLGFLFGGFGVMYVSFTQGLMAIGATFFVGLLTAGVGFVPMWFACAIWGYVAAQSHNEEVLAQNVKAYELEQNSFESQSRQYAKPQSGVGTSIVPPSIAPPSIAPPSHSVNTFQNSPVSLVPPPSASQFSVSQANQPLRRPSANLYCHNCGAELRAQAKFCSSCGTAT